MKILIWLLYSPAVLLFIIMLVEIYKEIAWHIWGTYTCEVCGKLVPRRKAVVQLWGMGSTCGFHVAHVWCPECEPKKKKGSIHGISVVTKG